MTIYVDEPIFEFRGQKYCHLWTDGELFELHSFIQRIGMDMKWFQSKHQDGISWDHYDCGPKFRERAVKAGAVEVDRFAAAEHRLKKVGYWTKEDAKRFANMRARRQSKLTA